MYCKRCGEEITDGYAINPVNSDLCADCNDALEEEDDDLYDDGGNFDGPASFED